MFGEIFRNIFGWHVMRPSAMDKELFNDLYRMYIKDENKLGIHEYFLRVNPAAFQADVYKRQSYNGYQNADGKLMTVHYLGNNKALVYARNDKAPISDKAAAAGIKKPTAIDAFSHYYLSLIHI